MCVLCCRMSNSNMSRSQENVNVPSFEATFIGAMLQNESVLKNHIRSLAEELDKTKKELKEAQENVDSERALNDIQFRAYVDELMEAETKIEKLENELKKQKSK